MNVSSQAALERSGSEVAVAEKGDAPNLASGQGSKTSLEGGKQAYASFRRSSSLHEPGMVLPHALPSNGSSASMFSAGGDGPLEGGLSLRVYGADAVVAPGVLYKSILVTPDMTAVEVIKRTLERYGESSDVSAFELHYARIAEAPKKKGFFSLRRSSKSKLDEHVLRDDEAPVLVAESYSEEARRFELHRRKSKSSSKKDKKSKGGSSTSVGTSGSSSALPTATAATTTTAMGAAATTAAARTSTTVREVDEFFTGPSSSPEPSESGAHTTSVGLGQGLGHGSSPLVPSSHPHNDHADGAGNDAAIAESTELDVDAVSSSQRAVVLGSALAGDEQEAASAAVEDAEQGTETAVVGDDDVVVVAAISNSVPGGTTDNIQVTGTEEEARKKDEAEIDAHSDSVADIIDLDATRFLPDNNRGNTASATGTTTTTTTTVTTTTTTTTVASVASEKSSSVTTIDTDLVGMEATPARAAPAPARSGSGYRVLDFATHVEESSTDDILDLLDDSAPAASVALHSPNDSNLHGSTVGDASSIVLPSPVVYGGAASGLNFGAGSLREDADVTFSGADGSVVDPSLANASGMAVRGDTTIFSDAGVDVTLGSGYIHNLSLNAGTPGATAVDSANMTNVSEMEVETLHFVPGSAAVGDDEHTAHRESTTDDVPPQPERSVSSEVLGFTVTTASGFVSNGGSSNPAPVAEEELHQETAVAALDVITSGDGQAEVDDSAVEAILDALQDEQQVAHEEEVGVLEITSTKKEGAATVPSSEHQQQHHAPAAEAEGAAAVSSDDGAQDISSVAVVPEIVTTTTIPVVAVLDVTEDDAVEGFASTTADDAAATATAATAAGAGAGAGAVAAAEPTQDLEAEAQVPDLEPATTHPVEDVVASSGEASHDDVAAVGAPIKSAAEASSENADIVQVDSEDLDSHEHHHHHHEEAQGEEHTESATAADTAVCSCCTCEATVDPAEGAVVASESQTNDKTVKNVPRMALPLPRARRAESSAPTDPTTLLASIAKALPPTADSIPVTPAATANKAFSAALISSHVGAASAAVKTSPSSSSTTTKTTKTTATTNTRVSSAQASPSSHGAPGLAQKPIVKVPVPYSPHDPAPSLFAHSTKASDLTASPIAVEFANKGSSVPKKATDSVVLGPRMRRLANKVADGDEAAVEAEATAGSGNAPESPFVARSTDLSAHATAGIVAPVATTADVSVVASSPSATGTNFGRSVSLPPSTTPPASFASTLHPSSFSSSLASASPSSSHAAPVSPKFSIVEESVVVSDTGLRSTGVNYQALGKRSPSSKVETPPVPSAAEAGLRSTGTNYDALGVRQPKAVSSPAPVPSAADLGLRSTGISLTKIGRTASLNVTSPSSRAAALPSTAALGLKSTGVNVHELEKKSTATRSTVAQPPQKLANLRPVSVAAPKAESPVQSGRSTPTLLSLRPTGVNLATLDTLAASTSADASKRAQASAGARGSGSGVDEDVRCSSPADLGLRSTGISLSALEAKKTAPAEPTLLPIEVGLRTTGISLAALDAKKPASPVAEVTALVVNPGDMGLRSTGISLAALEAKRATSTTPSELPVEVGLRPTGISLASLDSTKRPTTASATTSAAGSAFGTAGDSASLLDLGLRPTGISLAALEAKKTTSAVLHEPSAAPHIEAGLRSTGISLAALEKKEEASSHRRPSAPLPTRADLGLRATGVALHDLDRKSTSTTSYSSTATTTTTATSSSSNITSPPANKAKDLGLRSTGIALSSLDRKAPPAPSAPSGELAGRKPQLRQTGVNLTTTTTTARPRSSFGGAGTSSSTSSSSSSSTTTTSAGLAGLRPAGALPRSAALRLSSICGVDLDVVEEK